jgi:hypothetical protein
MGFTTSNARLAIYRAPAGAAAQAIASRGLCGRSTQ